MWGFVEQAGRRIAPFYYVTFFVVTFVGGFTTILGFINRNSEVFVEFFPEIIPRNIEIFLYQNRYFIGFLSISLISLLILMRRAAYRKRITKAIDELGSFSTTSHAFYNECMVFLAQNPSVDHEKFQEFSKQCVLHAELTLNRVNCIVSEYCRVKCHASLKYFDRLSGSVSTIARDGLDNGIRKDVDVVLDSFDYKENTAFRKIIEDEDCSWYSGNFLRLRKYQNINKEWKKYYNSTMVVPVSLIRRASGINDQTVNGFLCVDSKAHKFADNELSKLLFICASVYVYLLEITELLQKAAESGNTVEQSTRVER